MTHVGRGVLGVEDEKSVGCTTQKEKLIGCRFTCALMSLTDVAEYFYAAVNGKQSWHACVARGERWCCQQEQHRPGEVLISILYTSGHSGCDASLPYVHMGVTCCMSWGQLDGFDLCELWSAWCIKMLLSSIISGTRSCSLGLFSSPTADRSWGKLSFELCGL